MLLIVMSLKAYADECEHLNRATEYLGREFYIIDAEFHQCKEEWMQECVYCGDITKTYRLYSPTRHDMACESHWHVEGEYVHHYRMVCTDCGCVVYTTKPCSGENCMKQSAMMRRK